MYVSVHGTSSIAGPPYAEQPKNNKKKVYFSSKLQICSLFS